MLRRWPPSDEATALRDEATALRNSPRSGGRTELLPCLRAISSRVAQRRREGTEGGPIYKAALRRVVTA